MTLASHFFGRRTICLPSRPASFHRNFRFTKHNMLKVVDLIKEDIQFASARGSPLTPMQQVTLTLSMFASGNFQHVAGYLAGKKFQESC